VKEKSDLAAQADREATVWDFDGTRRHHIRAGFQMDPVDRLRWLEETVDEMRRLQGLARQGTTVR
jgi:hypothetical protein